MWSATHIHPLADFAVIYNLSQIKSPTLPPMDTWDVSPQILKPSPTLIFRNNSEEKSTKYKTSKLKNPHELFDSVSEWLKLIKKLLYNNFYNKWRCFWLVSKTSIDRCFVCCTYWRPAFTVTFLKISDGNI